MRQSPILGRDVVCAAERWFFIECSEREKESDAPCPWLCVTEILELILHHSISTLYQVDVVLPAVARPRAPELLQLAVVRFIVLVRGRPAHRRGTTTAVVSSGVLSQHEDEFVSVCFPS